MKITKLLSRAALTTAIAGGMILAVGTPLRADRDYTNSCKERLENDRARIDHDAARHGNDSRQVNNDVNRMDEDRNWCKSHHSDWDHTRFDVGIYFRPGH